MALTPEEINQAAEAQKRLNEKIAEYNRLSGESLKNPIDPKNYSDAAKYNKALNDELKKTDAILVNVKSGLEGIKSQFQDIGKELNTSWGSAVKNATKSVSKIYSLTEDLYDAQYDLTQTSSKQLKIDKERVQLEFQRIKRQRDSLKLKKEELDKDIAILKNNKDRSKADDARIKRLEAEKNKTTELLGIAEDQYEENVGYQKDINNAYDHTISRVEVLNHATGLTGKLLEGIGGTLEKLGFKGISEKVGEINQELKQSAVK